MITSWVSQRVYEESWRPLYAVAAATRKMASCTKFMTLVCQLQQEIFRLASDKY